MSHAEGHTDLESLGGFEKGVWLIVRAPMSVNGFDELDPESYHQLVHVVGGDGHDPVRGLAFLLGHSLGWRDNIRWNPDKEGEDWQRLQWMLADEGDDSDNPTGENGRYYLQNAVGHAPPNIRVAAFLECGYGGYKHPIAEALGISSVLEGLSSSVKVTQALSPINIPGGPLPEDVPDSSEAGLIWPFCGNITSPFGNRIHPITLLVRFHPGIDIGGGGIGFPIVAAHAGTVVFAGGNRVVGYGLYVDLISSELGLGTRYAHLDSIGVTQGQAVAQGQVIGLMGTTGSSTGPHLHFQVHAPVANASHMNTSTALDPVSYLPAECAGVPVGDLPLGIGTPAGSYTSWVKEQLDGTVLSLVGDEWKDGPDDPPHTSEAGTWRRLTNMVSMVHRRSQIIGLSPILIAPDGEDIGGQWQNGDVQFDTPAWAAVNGNHYLSARSFWAPRIRATSGEEGIRSAWHFAIDAFIGLLYGRCELVVDVEGANVTHIQNIIGWAGSGVVKAGMRRESPEIEETVTSGLVFLDDAQKILDQGLISGIEPLSWDDLNFWNYGTRWKQLVMKWATTTPVADMKILTPSGGAVSIDNEIGLMPLMIVGDFFGRLLFENVDWKTADRLPTILWFENLDWVSGQSAPLHFHEIARGDATSLGFGIFFFELVQKDSFSLERFQFATGDFESGVIFGNKLINSEWAYFGSAGAQGVHGWHMHMERGILAEGFMDTMDFIWFPVDPRLMDKDHQDVPQGPAGTLGGFKIVQGPFLDDEGDPVRKDTNAQPASRIIHPRGSVPAPTGDAPKYHPREFELPFNEQPQVTALLPAPGPFIPAPVGPPPGGSLPEGVDEVYISGSTTIFGAFTVNNSILNSMFQMLVFPTNSDNNGTYQLAWYIALMLRESGGDPGAVGICLSGLGHAIGLFQLLTGADPECSGPGGMGHPYSKAELQNIPTNINIARNALLRLWDAAVAASGDPPSPGAVEYQFGPNPWEATSNAIPLWLAIRDGVVGLEFPLPA